MRFYQPLLNWLLRRASRIVVATPPQLEHSPVLPRYRSKCAVIPFGLDLARFLTPPEPTGGIETARALAGGRPILLNIGRLVGYKGQRHLIEALRHTGAVAWLVGSGPLRGELEQVARDHGVADRVRFWGEVPDDLLPRLLHACDVFVLSSITPNEAFGLVQVEAMACGKPVICGQLASGVPYVNQHGHTGLVVPPGDVPALAKAIRTLGDNPGLRQTLGDAGRARAIAEFSLERMIDRYWRLLHEVTGAALPQ
jgi:rhamnosyl/mannosyltransferase